MKLNVRLKIVGLAVLLIASIGLKAQTEQEALEAYNEGVQLAQFNSLNDAIEAYKECVEIFNQLGEDVSEENLSVKVTAETQIPALQYKIAAGLVKEKKYEEAIDAFKVLKMYSEEYNNEKYLKRAESTIPKLYYTIGRNYAAKDQVDPAIENYQKAIELDPDYSTAYLRLAQVYGDKGDEENFKVNIDKVIEIGEKKNSSKTIKNGKIIARKYYSQKGANAFSEKDYPLAERYFGYLIKYLDDKTDVYYQLALIYNAQTKYNEAIDAANKALELFTEEGTTKDAKIYFQLGTALHGMGKDAEACDAFKKAQKGDYEEQAKYQIEHVLKCQ